MVPGNIDPDFRRFMDDDTQEAFDREVISRVPLARAGTSDEAAAVSLFPLSDDASYVTGSQYAADGGPHQTVNLIDPSRRPGGHGTAPLAAARSCVVAGWT